MEDRKTLIDRNLLAPACELLKNKRIKDHNFEKPKHPVCVFYLGKGAKGYQKEMNNDLIRGWGDSATQIKHICINNPEDMIGSMTDANDNAMSVEMLRNEVTGMMTRADVFDDMNLVHIYCFIDTTAMLSEEFEKWYTFTLELSKVLPVSLRTAFIVILNQSLNYVERSEQVRAKLLELYKSDAYSEPNSHAYNAVYLFSNKLKNGVFITLDSESEDYQEYNLFADVILLSNTNNSEVNTRIINLYDRRTPAFTAAYSNLSKPIKDIVMITLKKCLAVVRTHIDDINAREVVSEDIIPRILNITNGSMPFINQFFDDHIRPRIPDFQSLEYLPTESSCLKLPYEEADVRTQGCLGLFVQRNYFDTAQRIIDLHKSDLMQKIKSYIKSNMTVAQQRSFQFFGGDLDAIVKNVLSYKTDMDANKKANVADAIAMMTKKNVINQIAPLVIEALEELRSNSRKSRELFGDLYEDINKMILSGEDGLRQNLKSFYENIVEMYYLETTRVDNLSKDILSCSSIEEMLVVLMKELNNIFGSNSVFTLSFFHELTERVKALGASVNVGEMITKELINNLDSRLALSSYNMYPECYFEAYFLNTNTGNNENLLYEALTKRESIKNITCHNTLSNDMVESIWFYRCTEDNVRI